MPFVSNSSTPITFSLQLPPPNSLCVILGYIHIHSFIHIAHLSLFVTHTRTCIAYRPVASIAPKITACLRAFLHPPEPHHSFDTTLPRFYLRRAGHLSSSPFFSPLYTSILYSFERGFLAFTAPLRLILGEFYILSPASGALQNCGNARNHPRSKSPSATLLL